MQKRAIRLITNSHYNAHAQPIFKSQNILKLCDLHKLQIHKFMFQYHQGNLPISLNSMFIQNYEIHNHVTRHRNDAHIQPRRTFQATQAIRHKGPKLWQNLSYDEKNNRTIHTFSRKIKQSMLNTY